MERSFRFLENWIGDGDKREIHIFIWLSCSFEFGVIREFVGNHWTRARIWGNILSWWGTTLSNPGKKNSSPNNQIWDWQSQMFPIRTCLVQLTMSPPTRYSVKWNETFRDNALSIEESKEWENSCLCIGCYDIAVEDYICKMTLIRKPREKVKLGL